MAAFFTSKPLWRGPDPALAVSLIVRVDGGSRGNPGPAGYGVAIEDEFGGPLTSLRAALGRQTNNYAEYCGLLAGLRYAREQGAQRVRVFADSQLLVRQMQGLYQVKSPNLQPLYAEARHLVAGFRDFAIAHVRREQNREADRLANLAMDEAAQTRPPA
ncbi:MAG: ribonuclease HI family protein [Terriglobales bacterium]